MAKNKTSATGASVHNFLKAVPNEERRQDAIALAGFLEKCTGLKPYMYGPTIVGFGEYHYQYDSGHSGTAPLAGFSPRKAEMVLYVEPEFNGREALIQKLGKHRTGKSCIYFKRLADINLPVVEQLVKRSVAHTRNRWPEKV